MTLAEMVTEYNTLVTKKIKGFNNRDIAERRLTGARIKLPTKKTASPAKKKVVASKKKTGTKKSVGLAVSVSGKKYASVTVAFKELKIASGSLSTLRRARKDLKLNGEVTVENHKFKMVK